MEKGKCYGYKTIETFAEENYFEVEEFGNNRIGEGFLILRHPNKDQVTSFVLSGSSISEYVYECIYSDS